MIVTQKAITRRTILRGLGASVALPLLDGMVPAFAAIRNSPAKPTLRFGAVYTPNGMLMRNFWPGTEGAGFEFSRILAPLTPFRENISILGGLANREAYPIGDEGVGDHSRSSSVFLTGVHPKKTDGPDMRAGLSFDQLLARHTEQFTQLPSLELISDTVDLVGACDPGYACPYTRTISWRTPTVPLPMENDPRVVFERLFGGSDTTDAAARAARIRKDKSILDSVTESVGGLQRKLGPGDRGKLNEYLEAVRDIERRIRRVEEQSGRELPVVEKPAGVAETFAEHAKMLFDLQVLAFQTDMTRVFTFMMAREVSGRPYPEIGIPDGHHPMTHNAVDPDPIEKVTKINTYHTAMFAHFLEKMRTTPDGDGSLLDHSMIVYGSGISNGNTHSHEDLPIVLAGGASVQLKGGRYLRYPEDTPLTNVYLTLLDKFGLPAEKFGDSTGRAQGLSI